MKTSTTGGMTFTTGRVSPPRSETPIARMERLVVIFSIGRDDWQSAHVLGRIRETDGNRRDGGTAHGIGAAPPDVEIRYRRSPRSFLCCRRLSGGGGRWPSRVAS